ncbi:hypothetical protein H8356DRAFT_1283705 [Neocallimastix lanati (nom. inval.)]|nr:hypothetical protein H8356DRAFT_1283705 [Neocallimastix sp. JGI-2020a]
MVFFFSDCYNRNEHTSMIFVPNNRDNPDDFDIKGYVNIKIIKASTLVPYKEIITVLFVSSVVISAVLSFVKIFDLLLPI